MVCAPRMAMLHACLCKDSRFQILVYEKCKKKMVKPHTDEKLHQLTDFSCIADQCQ